MTSGSTGVVDADLAATQTANSISPRTLVWALGSICALHGKPFDAQLLLSQFAPPYGAATLVTAARALGFDAQLTALPLKALVGAQGPRVLLLKDAPELGLLVQATASEVTWIAANTQDPITELWADFAPRYSGQVVTLQQQAQAPQDPDQDGPRGTAAPAAFGFRWFVPELLKHRKVWRDVLWASLVLQLLALGLPLFTQAIIDKVIHLSRDGVRAMHVVPTQAAGVEERPRG